MLCWFCLYYTCRDLYSHKPRKVLKSCNWTYVGDAEETLIVIMMEWFVLEMCIFCGWKFLTNGMRFPWCRFLTYILKDPLDFASLIFVVVDMWSFDEGEIVCLSIVVTKEEHICESTFHLGYGKSFKDLGHVNKRITLYQVIEIGLKCLWFFHMHSRALKRWLICNWSGGILWGLRMTFIWEEPCLMFLIVKNAMRVLMDWSFIFLSMTEKVKIHWCYDKVVDVRLILDGKIKLVSADVVLSLMTQVSEQYMIGIGRVGKTKYTTNQLFSQAYWSKMEFKRSFCEEIVCGMKWKGGKEPMKVIQLMKLSPKISLIIEWIFFFFFGFRNVYCLSQS